MTDQEKVYCSRCKHKNATGIEGWCSKDPEMWDRWDSRYAKYAECRHKNDSNNCKDFEPNLWQRIKRWLFH